MSKPNTRQSVRLVVATTAEQKALWHTEVARAYKAHAWDALQTKIGKSITKSRMMALVRLRELESLYAFRYGAMHLPQGDEAAALEYLEIAAQHIAHLHGEVEKHIIAWARCWAPWVPADQAERLAKRVAAKPRKWRADSMARELNVTKAERDALGLTTIGAVDFTKRQRTKAAKDRRSQRDRTRRERAAADAGRVLRARPGRPHRTTTPPWELAGMTRSTWYRHGKPSGTIILTHQGEGNEGREFLSHVSPSRAAAPTVQENDFFVGANTIRRGRARLDQARKGYQEERKAA
jgi:hypothetical protein